MRNLLFSPLRAILSLPLLIGFLILGLLYLREQRKRRGWPLTIRITPMTTPNPDPLPDTVGGGWRSETAWMIERDNGGAEYANGRGWSRDWREALRFMSKADAENFAQRAYKVNWSSEGPAYFDWQDYTRIAEHRWG